MEIYKVMKIMEFQSEGGASLFARWPRNKRATRELVSITVINTQPTNQPLPSPFSSSSSLLMCLCCGKCVVDNLPSNKKRKSNRAQRKKEERSFSVDARLFFKSLLCVCLCSVKNIQPRQSTPINRYGVRQKKKS